MSSALEKRLALSRVMAAWEKVPDMPLVDFLALHKPYPGEDPDVWLDGLDEAATTEKFRRAKGHLPRVPRHGFREG